MLKNDILGKWYWGKNGHDEKRPEENLVSGKRRAREKWRHVTKKLKILEMPFGLTPVLKIDGVMLPESHAIGRYLAKKFGLFKNRV